MLKSSNDKFHGCVRWNGSRFDFFECRSGTKQGALDSLILFSLLINFVVEFVREHGKTANMEFKCQK